MQRPFLPFSVVNILALNSSNDGHTHTHTHFNRPTAVLSPLSFHCRPLTSNLCALHCKVEKEQRALQCGRSMPIAVLSLQCDRYRMAGGHDYSTTLSIGQ